MRLRRRISPESYARVATIALLALALIVLTGAAVRLTGSGLGCPDWPKCYGKEIAPLETHAVIEYGNRLISGLVGVVAIAAFGLALLRRPFRRDLAVLAALLPVGVVGQAVLGGFTVRAHLAPGFVMAHFCLSMLILVAAVALAWRARNPGGHRPPSTDRWSVWAVRGLLPLGAITIFAGTAATAAGPHAGGMNGQKINRLTIHGSKTMDWAIHQHARIALVFGVATLAVWWLLRRRRADPDTHRSLAIVLALLALQGAVGTTQYLLHLPAVIVWVHVGVASFTWLALLWAVAQAGRLRTRVYEASAGRTTGPMSAPIAASAASVTSAHAGGSRRRRARPHDRWRRDSEPT
jgi:cytochrome c oxidase assembly protein subunit 15